MILADVFLENSNLDYPPEIIKKYNYLNLERVAHKIPQKFKTYLNLMISTKYNNLIFENFEQLYDDILFIISGIQRSNFDYSNMSDLIFNVDENKMPVLTIRGMYLNPCYSEHKYTMHPMYLNSIPRHSSSYKFIFQDPKDLNLILTHKIPFLSEEDQKLMIHNLNKINCHNKKNEYSQLCAVLNKVININNINNES